VLGLQPSVRIIGYSSPEGSELINSALSELRAKHVWQLLQPLALRRLSLVPVGGGVDSSSLTAPDARKAFESSRRVFFEVERQPV
jgi:outer membrane protein OmpA-like peptidoglycan-associated protein